MSKFIVISIILLLICSCSNEQKKAVDEDTQDTVQSTKVLSFHEKDVLEIIMSQCPEKFEHAYTNENTWFANLDVENHLTCFVVSSELDCGAPMGSCGKKIAVYEKKNNQWRQIFEECGFDVRVSGLSQNDRLIFTYRNRDNTVSEVRWNKDSFDVQTIRMHDLPPLHLKKIAQGAGVPESRIVSRNLHPDGYERNTIAKGIIAYTGGPGNLFVFMDDSLVLHKLDILSAEFVKTKGKKIPMIKILDNKNIYINNDTSFVRPEYYYYNKSDGKFIRQYQEVTTLQTSGW